MRFSSVLEPEAFSPAERSALRLDGDCVPLGLADVSVDVPVTSALRAGTLAAVTGRFGLVADTWTAAWVHGVVAGLPDPLTLAVDVRTSRRAIGGAHPPREARFRPDDLMVLEGVRVTTPVKTAFDLLRLDPTGSAAVDAAASDLLAVAAVRPTLAAALAQLQPRCSNKARGIRRLAALPAPRGVDARDGQGSGASEQHRGTRTPTDEVSPR